MKKNIFIISIVILGLLLLVVLVSYKKNSGVKTEEFSNIENMIKDKDEGIIYVSSTDEEPPYYRYFLDKYKTRITKTKANIDQVNDLLLTYGVEKASTLPCFIVYSDKKVIGSFDGTLNETETNEMFRYIYYNEIPTKMIKYKTLSTADEYIKKFNSNELTVAVFGYDECSYCNLYKPVFNKVAGDKKIDIYYFDSNKYDEKEYDKLMKLDIPIPAECTTDGKATTTLEGFPKPMTLVTKKGKLVGCVLGYVTEENLIKKLTEFKVLKG